MAYQILSPLKNPVKSVLSLDVEQDSEGKAYVFCVCGHANGRKKPIDRTFYTAKECADFLFSPKKKWFKTVLTGNNLLFDLNHLTLAGVWNWDVMASNGNFISAYPPKGGSYDSKGTIKIIELNSFYPRQPLKTMVEDKEGNPYVDYMEFCVVNGAPPHKDKHILGEDGDMNEMVEACRSHCWAAVYALEKMQAQIIHLGSGLEITPALTAQKLHKRCYLDPECQIFGGGLDTTTHEDKLFMNQAYYGGRTEMFLNKDQIDEKIDNVTCIDINSSYPFSMRNKDYPDIRHFMLLHGEKFSPEQLIRLMDKAEGLATVMIKSPKDMRIAFLPFKDEGKLIFPEGTWRATYTFPELKYALKLGYQILEVLMVGKCDTTKKPFFKAYVDGLYPLKNDVRYKAGAKLMLNSLYGKFGQKANESSGWQICRDEEEVDLSLDTFKVGLNGILWEYYPETPIGTRGFAKHAYPLIAAYVTSYSRIYLYEAMMAIGEENVYYTDTDSIYGDADAIIRAIENKAIKVDSGELGAWDIEHEGVEAEFRGLKYYRLLENGKHIYKIKGIPQKSQEEFWDNRECKVNRVWKRPSAIRHGKPLNQFYDHPMKEGNPSPKRRFNEAGKSLPISLESIL